MIVLVDFENTHQSGFNGYEYLNETDTLVVYYSDENSALSRGMVEDLKERKVNVKMVKLLKQHSNALDMYIASTTGMYLESGEKICIVSKDKGYAAVRDFWHSLRGAEILLGETIEECFLHSVQNDDERIRSAKERYQKVQLTQAFETMNKVPTRPTLSRNNRKKRDYDTNHNLEPIALLPDPLAKKLIVDKEEVNTDTEKPEIENVPNSKEDGIGNNENTTETANTESHEKTANTATVKKETAISYVYDPVSRTMKRVGYAEPNTGDKSNSSELISASDAVKDEFQKEKLSKTDEDSKLSSEDIQSKGPDEETVKDEAEIEELNEKPAHRKRRRRRKKVTAEKDTLVNEEEVSSDDDKASDADASDTKKQGKKSSKSSGTEKRSEEAELPKELTEEKTAEKNEKTVARKKENTAKQVKEKKREETEDKKKEEQKEKTSVRKKGPKPKPIKEEKKEEAEDNIKEEPEENKEVTSKTQKKKTVNKKDSSKSKKETAEQKEDASNGSEEKKTVRRRGRKSAVNKEDAQRKDSENQVNTEGPSAS